MHGSIEDFSMPDDSDVERVVDTLRILGDPTRLKILCALSQGESSVACLAELAGVTPTLVSQHLGKLRLAGVVRARRQGTFQYYCVVDDEILALVQGLLAPSPRPSRPAGARS